MSIMDNFVTKLNYKTHITILDIKNRRLKNCLNEVKKILEKLLSITDEYGNCYYKDRCEICTKTCQYKLVDKALKKLERINND